MVKINKDKIINFRLSEEDKEKLNVIAKRNGLSYSKIIRRLIVNEYKYVSQD